MGELSGPRPLHWVADIDSKPHIWNHNAGAVSFKTQPPDQIMGSGKDHNQTCLRPFEFSPYFYTSTFNFIELCHMEGHGC